MRIWPRYNSIMIIHEVKPFLPQSLTKHRMPKSVFLNKISQERQLLFQFERIVLILGTTKSGHVIYENLINFLVLL